MATLESVSGASFVPQLSAAFEKGIAGFREQEERQKEEIRRGEISTEAEILSDIETSEARKDRALLRITALDPELGKALAGIRQSGDVAAMAKAQQEASRGLRNAKFVKSKRTFAEKQTAWREIITDKISKGLDVSQDIEALNLTEDEFNNKMDRMILAGTDIETLTEETLVEKFEPITDAQGNVIAQKNIRTGKVIADPRAPTAPMETFEPVFDKEGNVIAQKSSSGKIIADPRTTKPQQPLSPIGKARSDLRAGRITQEDFDTLSAVESGGSVKLGGDVITKVGDKFFFAQQVTGPDGTAKTVLSEIPGSPVNPKTGLSLAQEQSAKAKGAGEKTEEELKAEAEGRPAVIRAEKRTAGTETRIQKFISSGLIAAEATPQIKRSLELLKEIKTGGFEQVNLKFKLATGIESANESELAFNLAKNVLKQLKPTFGSAFTEKEGRMLTTIEAGIGKSTAGNIRLLKRALEIYDRSIKRGLRSARQAGDLFAIREIKEARKALAVLSGEINEEQGTIKPPPGQENSVFTGRKSSEGFNIFRRPDGTFFKVKP